MKIVIINCHWDNRGDEAAIRAMIDELSKCYPRADIYVQRALGTFEFFPTSEHVKIMPAFPVGGRRRSIQEKISLLSKGKINLTKGGREFFDIIKDATIVIHAPGGPSIGDIYFIQERLKLQRLQMICDSKVPYAFYAPSMGPFYNKKRNPIRKRILEEASLICLREELSAKMVKEFAPKTNPIVTLDAAFQHPIDLIESQRILNDYSELKEFIGSGEQVIGITITDLQWNSMYANDGYTKEHIREVFNTFIEYLVQNHYKVLFIPQLFEAGNDFDYMKSFAINNCMVMSDQYDCYFQQYVISQIKAVVGMRYHSNIFSAKMGTPFVSVSYEQKMQGFMEKAELMDYCMSMKNLTSSNLMDTFSNMMEQYKSYRADLEAKREEFRKESYKTTELICEVIARLE